MTSSTIWCGLPVFLVCAWSMVIILPVPLPRVGFVLFSERIFGGSAGSSVFRNVFVSFRCRILRHVQKHDGEQGKSFRHESASRQSILSNLTHACAGHDLSFLYTRVLMFVCIFVFAYVV